MRFFTWNGNTHELCIWIASIHGDQADSTVILTALGVDLIGNKEVVARHSCAEEGKEGWVSVLEDLRRCGGTHIDPFEDCHLVKIDTQKIGSPAYIALIKHLQFYLFAQSISVKQQPP